LCIGGRHGRVIPRPDDPDRRSGRTL